MNKNTIVSKQMIQQNNDPTCTSQSNQSCAKTTSTVGQKEDDVNMLDSYLNDQLKNGDIVPYEKVKNYKYVVKRKWNKSFDDFNLPDSSGVVHHSQLVGWDTHIFTKNNITTFNSIKTPSEKSQFIVNIIMDYDLVNSVVKLDEQANPKVFKHQSLDDIFEFLRNSFAKRSSNINSNEKGKQKLVKVKIKLDTKQTSTATKKPPTYTSTNDESHPINSSLSFNNLYHIDVQRDKWIDTIVKKNKTENLFHDYNSQMYKDEISHSMFSVIHPLFEDYQLRIYNGSHRLDYTKDNIPTIHSPSLVKVKIPAPTQCRLKSFFVIFNSRIVHGGSRTLRPALLSSHFQLNFRLFNYVMLSYNDTRQKIGLPMSNEHEAVLVNGDTDLIDNTTFDICNINECSVCKRLDKKLSTLGVKEMTVDVREEYEIKITNSSKDIKDDHGILRPASYVCGDLDKHGWEVHEGISYMKDLEKYRFLRLHLEQLQIKGGSQWTSIRASAGRQFIKLTEEVQRENHQTWLSRKFLTDICFQDLSNIIKNIPGFSGHDMQGHLLLANRRVSQDQNPHRDYNKFTPTKKRKASETNVLSKNYSILDSQDTTTGPEDVSFPQKRTSSRSRSQPSYYI